MDALLVIDMQKELLDGKQKFDLERVIQRINRLSAAVRDRRGKVVWVQHCGQPGENTAPRAPGWGFLPQLERRVDDETISKHLNDCFAGTLLHKKLQDIGVDRIMICGWATDFCVDAAVRSAVSCNYDVIAVSDAHTVSDRPHLGAPSVIQHHNWLWANLISRRSVRVVSTSDLLSQYY